MSVITPLTQTWSFPLQVRYPHQWPAKYKGKVLRPFTVNFVYSNAWTVVGKHVAAWRKATCLTFEQKYGTMTARRPIIVYTQPFLRDGRTQDTGAAYPTTKAIVDGLVDAGLIKDDSAEFIAEIRLLGPVLHTGRDGMFVFASEVLMGESLVPQQYAKDLMDFVKEKEAKPKEVTNG